MQPSCLIIGAGMSGLAAAQVLSSRGVACVMLDKGRGPGGRMATRRIRSSRFDHGAQFFTARDPVFRAEVARWEQAGWVVPWFCKDGETCYRAVDGMNALLKQLAKPLDVRTGVLVTGLAAVDGRWRATTDSGEAWEADKLLLTAPAPQALALLQPVAGVSADLLGALAAIRYDPCFALLVVLEGPGGIEAPGFVRPVDGPIEWIADNTVKSLSEGPGAITVHASPQFSRQHLESPPEEVAKLLLEAAAPWLDSAVAEWQVHRWRYARPVTRSAELFLRSAHPVPLAIAGDMLGGPRVEGAFVSGIAAAHWLAT